MFSLGEEPAKLEKNSVENPLLIPEESFTWHLLLCHMDSLITIPPFDHTTITSLLYAAEKYQIEVVLDWFHEEVERVPFNYQDISPPHIMEHPLLILFLSTHHNMPNLSRLALRELIRCDGNLLNEDVDIDIALYRYIISLRGERIAWFCSSFMRIIGIEQQRVAPPPQARPVGELNSLFYTTVIQCQSKGQCQCQGQWSSCQIFWIAKVIEAMRTTPSWRAFGTVYKSYTCRKEWSCHLQRKFDETMAQALVKEEELLDLPNW